MKYKDFFTELTSLGQNFSAPQPDFERYGSYEEDPHKKIEELITLLEKNTPTNPSKWAAAKAAAKRKFKVYPSAYANLWAAKKYKSMGGGWKKGKK